MAIKRLSILLCLMLLNTTIAYAMSAVDMHKMVIARKNASGGTPGGTTLAGDESTYENGGYSTLDPDIIWRWQVTASASGNLTKGYWYSAYGRTVNMKMYVYDASDNLIEASDAISTQPNNDWCEFTFDGTSAITSGNTYGLALHADGEIQCDPGGTTRLPYDGYAYSSGAHDPWAQDNAGYEVLPIGMYITN